MCLCPYYEAAPLGPEKGEKSEIRAAFKGTSTRLKMSIMIPFFAEIKKYVFLYFCNSLFMEHF